MDGSTDGELLTPVGAGAAADAASNDIDDSLMHSCTLPTMDEEPAINDSSGGALLISSICIDFQYVESSFARLPKVMKCVK